MQRPLALTASDGLLGTTRSSAKETFRDVLLVAAGAVLVGAAAQISIPLPFTPVPITGPDVRGAPGGGVAWLGPGGGIARAVRRRGGTGPALFRRRRSRSVGRRRRLRRIPA